MCRRSVFTSSVLAHSSMVLLFTLLIIFSTQCTARISLPADLRPSHEVHSGGGRELCSAVISMAEKTKRNRNFPALKAFKAIINTLNKAASSNVDGEDINPDKAVFKAFLVLAQTWTRGTQSLDWRTFQRLTSCVVDNAAGRTILLELVNQGLMESIKHPIALKLAVDHVDQLVDFNGNNIIHLAVNTGNVGVVEIVMSLTGEHTRKLLESQNTKHQTPRDFAISLGRTDILDALQARYTVETIGTGDQNLLQLGRVGTRQSVHLPPDAAMAQTMASSSRGGANSLQLLPPAAADAQLQQPISMPVPVAAAVHSQYRPAAQSQYQAVPHYQPVALGPSSLPRAASAVGAVRSAQQQHTSVVPPPTAGAVSGHHNQLAMMPHIHETVKSLGAPHQLPVGANSIPQVPLPRISSYKPVHMPPVGPSELPNAQSALQSSNLQSLLPDVQTVKSEKKPSDPISFPVDPNLASFPLLDKSSGAINRSTCFPYYVCLVVLVAFGFFRT